MKRKLSSGDSSGTEYKVAKKECLDSSDDDDDDMDSKSPRCGVIETEESCFCIRALRLTSSFFSNS